MAGWGLGPWGLSGWGVPGLGDGLELILAQAVRDNVVRLYFNRPIYFSRLSNPGDAALIERYELQTVAGTVGEDGLPVRPVSPAVAELATVEGAMGQAIDLTVDRMFSPYPAEYVVVVNGLRATTGEVLTPGRTSFQFYGLAEFVPDLTPGEILVRGDIANPQTREAVGVGVALSEITALGSYPVDETGDYALDQGLTSYRKRIFRRLTTRRGAFAHLPDYGVGLVEQVKKLARAGTREALAAEAEAQIRQEPETAAVSVTVSQSLTEPGLSFFVVRARTKANDGVNLSVPITIG